MARLIYLSNCRSEFPLKYPYLLLINCLLNFAAASVCFFTAVERLSRCLGLLKKARLRGDVSHRDALSLMLDLVRVLQVGEALLRSVRVVTEDAVLFLECLAHVCGNAARAHGEL